MSVDLDPGKIGLLQRQILDGYKYRMDQMLGDELSRSLLDLTTSGNLQASPAHNASYSSGFPQGKNMLVIHIFILVFWL